MLTERIDVGLPFDKPVEVADLGGSVKLVEARSTHDTQRRERSRGKIELTRDGATETIAFDANTAFEAWDLRMVVWGASGSYQLSIYPPGEPIMP